MASLIKLTEESDAYLIKNLWPLYQHELSQFNNALPNRYGLFGVDDNVKTLAQHSEFQNAWWQRPDSLYPYLISVDGNAAGFNLIASKNSFAQEINADFVVHEFFLLHTYRRKGIAEKAAIDGFSKHKGKWEIVADPSNKIAIAFWEKTIRKYTNELFTKEEREHVWGLKTCFTFCN